MPEEGGSVGKVAMVVSIPFYSAFVNILTRPVICQYYIFKKASSAAYPVALAVAEALGLQQDLLIDLFLGYPILKIGCVGVNLGRVSTSLM